MTGVQTCALPIYKRLADRLTEKSTIIDENLKGYRFADNMELISGMVFG